MSRCVKLLILDLVAFYALGCLLALRAYMLDDLDPFVVIADLWIKCTIFIVLVGVAYWGYYAIRGLFDDF